jgi:hypothetical protein
VGRLLKASVAMSERESNAARQRPYRKSGQLVRGVVNLCGRCPLHFDTRLAKEHCAQSGGVHDAPIWLYDVSGNQERR